jgi:hypothetical protein
MELAAHKSSDNGQSHPRKPTARSRVSNGRDVLPNVDGRSLIARRYRDISTAILIDQGGVDQCSESRLQLIRRFAAAACLAEQMESRLANGEQIDIGEHATLSSTLVRLAAKIGIDRVPQDVTPSLAEYLARHDADQTAAEPLDKGTLTGEPADGEVTGDADDDEAAI